MIVERVVKFLELQYVQNADMIQMLLLTEQNTFYYQYQPLSASIHFRRLPHHGSLATSFVVVARVGACPSFDGVQENQRYGGKPVIGNGR